MNTKEFIESGILESYMVGFANKEEQEEVKQRVLAEPEIVDYIADFESGIKHYFDYSATPPPPEIREIVELRSTKNDLRKKKHAFNDVQKQEKKGRNEYLDIEVNDTHIKVHKNWRPAFIAIFILSKIFLIAGLYYYFKTVNLENEVVRLKTEIQQLK